eukprot:GDKJ01008274.1.p1 GENE.GDKJ01008274.1~~GDKJ01008274.1.p1  ORF type:complete len:1314 (-),score=399.66 GDKJ01008274.1:297-4238(-)
MNIQNQILQSNETVLGNRNISIAPMGFRQMFPSNSIAPSASLPNNQVYHQIGAPVAHRVIGAQPFYPTQSFQRLGTGVITNESDLRTLTSKQNIPQFAPIPNQPVNTVAYMASSINGPTHIHPPSIATSSGGFFYNLPQAGKTPQIVQSGKESPSTNNPPQILTMKGLAHPVLSHTPAQPINTIVPSAVAPAAVAPLLLNSNTKELSGSTAAILSARAISPLPPQQVAPLLLSSPSPSLAPAIVNASSAQVLVTSAPLQQTTNNPLFAANSPNNNQSLLSPRLSPIEKQQASPVAQNQQTVLNNSLLQQSIAAIRSSQQAEQSSPSEIRSSSLQPQLMNQKFLEVTQSETNEEIEENRQEQQQVENQQQQQQYSARNNKKDRAASSGQHHHHHATRPTSLSAIPRAVHTASLNNNKLSYSSPVQASAAPKSSKRSIGTSSTANDNQATRSKSSSGGKLHASSSDVLPHSARKEEETSHHSRPVDNSFHTQQINTSGLRALDEEEQQRMEIFEEEDDEAANGSHIQHNHPREHTSNGNSSNHNNQTHADCAACERDARIAARFNALYSDSHFRELRRQKLREAILSKEINANNADDNRQMHPSEWARKYDAMLKHRAQIKETLEAERLRRERERENAELTDCTFKPAISKRMLPSQAAFSINPLQQQLQQQQQPQAIPGYLRETGNSRSKAVPPRHLSERSASQSRAPGLISSSSSRNIHLQSNKSNSLTNASPVPRRNSSNSHQPSPAINTAPRSARRPDSSVSSRGREKKNTSTSSSSGGMTSVPMMTPIVIDPSDIRVRALELLKLISAQQQPLAAELHTITANLSEAISLEKSRSEGALVLALSENENEVALWMQQGDGLHALEERARLYIEYNPGLEYERAVEEARNDVFQSNAQHVKDAMAKKLELSIERLNFEASEKRRMLGEALKDLSVEVAEVCKEFILNNTSHIAQFMPVPDVSSDFPVPSSPLQRDAMVVRELPEEIIFKHRRPRLLCVAQLAGMSPTITQMLQNEFMFNKMNANGISIVVTTQAKKDYLDAVLPRYFDDIHFTILSNTKKCPFSPSDPSSAPHDDAPLSIVTPQVQPSILNAIPNTPSTSTTTAASSHNARGQTFSSAHRSASSSSKNLNGSSSSSHAVQKNTTPIRGSSPSLQQSSASRLPPSSANSQQRGARLVSSNARQPSSSAISGQRISQFSSNSAGNIRNSNANSKLASASPLKTSTGGGAGIISISTNGNCAVSRQRGSRVTACAVKAGEVGAQASALAAKMALECNVNMSSTIVTSLTVEDDVVGNFENRSGREIFDGSSGCVA